MDPRLEPLLDHPPLWLRPGGPAGDVVVASRVRLARNLADQKFPHLMVVEEARRLCRLARERLGSLFEGCIALDPSELRSADRELLVERSLASRDLIDAPRPTLVMFDRSESVGLLVNEEDHFRLQGLVPGLDLLRAYRLIGAISRQLSRSFNLATSRRYGFLTACPTNVGTGLRASLLMHLPALARAKTPLQRALQAAQRAHLAVRGVHGEGSRALGHLYQISNQRTLGSDAFQQIQTVAEYGQRVAEYEREVREALLREEGNRRSLLEDVKNAYQALAKSDRISTADALDALSTLRLAALGGLEQEVGHPLNPDLLLVNSFQLQPGHLQARIGTELAPAARDSSRAKLIRDALQIPYQKSG